MMYHPDKNLIDRYVKERDQDGAEYAAEVFGLLEQLNDLQVREASKFDGRE